MDKLIVKHFYTDLENDIFSEVYFDIFDNYASLYDFLINTYTDIVKIYDADFDESNIQLYRCGSISSLGEFTIYSLPLPIYLKEIKEKLKNG